MKFLLTFAGIKNASIHEAQVNLLGKPIADCSALCIPTAGYGHPCPPLRYSTSQRQHTVSMRLDSTTFA